MELIQLTTQIMQLRITFSNYVNLLIKQPHIAMSSVLNSENQTIRIDNMATSMEEV